MTTPRRGCIFCGSTTNKMSAEHLFRETYRNRIPHDATTARVRFDPRTPGSEQVTEMPHGMFDHKVNGVCKQCNESWMNALDLEVEDVVVGLATRKTNTIRGRDTLPLARWATKVALMRGWVDKSSGWEPDPHLFTVFHETRNPPPGTVVRVGVADEVLKQGGSNSSVAFLLTPKVALPEDQPQRTARFTLNAVSWCIGHLYIHVLLPSPQVEADMPRVSALVSQALGPTAVTIHPTRPRQITCTYRVSRLRAARAGNLHHLLGGAPLHPSD